MSCRSVSRPASSRLALKQRTQFILTRRDGLPVDGCDLPCRRALRDKSIHLTPEPPAGLGGGRHGLDSVKEYDIRAHTGYTVTDSTVTHDAHGRYQAHRPLLYTMQFALQTMSTVPGEVGDWLTESRIASAADRTLDAASELSPAATRRV